MWATHAGSRLQLLFTPQTLNLAILYMYVCLPELEKQSHDFGKIFRSLAKNNVVDISKRIMVLGTALNLNNKNKHFVHNMD
ncbi:hypothetical protein M758_11G031400 [Ceratodon purpureus]|nr:hypothetical protein M758_11G031400 [Ceratodon purpureus]